MPDTIVLDLDKPLRVLEEVLAVLEEIDQKQYPVDPDAGPARKNNPDLAKVSRDLLRAGELCRLAGSEVYTKYYELKGHVDPRNQ